MADIRATIAGLRAATDQLAGVAPVRFTFEAEYIALRDGTPPLLDALDRIAAVMDADESDPIVTIDEIRAILDGAVKP